jgi:hypothetical protein
VRARTVAIVLVTTCLGRMAHAAPPPPDPLVALAPPQGDDARRAVAIGPTGQVYEPDGKGAWVLHQAITTADKLGAAGRAGAAVVATGEGVVYRLAANGWSAIRLVQKGSAVMSSGPRSIAAVGRQLFALDRTAGGEPFKLALAPTAVHAIGSGARGLVVATETGLLRLDKAAWRPIKRAPRRVNRLVSDTWALVDRGALDLRSGTTTAWPAGVTVNLAAAGPTDTLVAVGQGRAGLEVLTLRAGKIQRDPIVLAAPATGQPVGIASDRAGRVVVALRDGRLAIRDHGTWTTTTVQEDLPEPHPGSPPATSP